MTGGSLRRAIAVIAVITMVAAAAWLLAPEFGGHWGTLTASLRLWQMDLQRDLTSAVKLMREGGWAAAWPLIGSSFLYGVVHAAGPGHGKAVIGAYVLADNRRLRRGLALAWASAMLQAVTAVALIAVASWALGMTAREAQAVGVWLERAGYGLILALGLVLLWRGGARLRGGPVAACGHDHHNHNHNHNHDHDHHHPHDHCGHAPAPPRDDADWRETAALLLSVGFRPCSGALLVLTFASAAGIAAAGIASAFAMAAGTAITVSALALFASSSRRLALTAAAGDGARLARIESGLIIVGGLALTAMGGLMLSASLAPTPPLPFR